MKDSKQGSEPWPEPVEKPMVLRDTIGTMREAVTVRDAKAHLSSLLDWVAHGREVVITSDGKPKARLVPVLAPERKIFQGMGAFLLSQPVHEGSRAEEVIGQDRDGRGW